MGVRTKLWTREEYDRLVAAGAFHPEVRAQLIQGEIVEMTPQSAVHATALRRTQKVLEAVFREGFDVRPQLPVALSSHSEPEPDIAVVSGSPEDYRRQHPTAAVLVVEIADTTLNFDRGRKQAMYAEAGIPDYWIVNLVDQVLEVYRLPRASTYGATLRIRPSERISPLAAPDAGIVVADLLP